MRVWMVRGGRAGEFEELMLEKGLAVIGWSQMPDLGQFSTKEELLAALRTAYPDSTEYRLGNFGGQLYSFAQRMSKGDLILLPRKSRLQIAVGRVTSTYKYRPELSRSPHTRSVEWMQTGIPRTRLGQDLLLSIGAIMTVCQIQRNNAESRIAALLETGADPGFATDGERTAEESARPKESEPLADIERLARDQILGHIQRHFKGHELARLVEYILQAEGYLTARAPAGPDGGVDILAGRGPLGLDPPRLAVQVKSSDMPSDVKVLRELQGAMSKFKAEQGLLVSWGGVNRVAEKEARVSFFMVRLWDADDLLQAILRNYDKLAEEIQSELPLKRIWTLVIEE